MIKRHHCNLSLPDDDDDEKINLNCLLLADTNAECTPVHVENLLQHFDNATQLTSGELLFLLVYIVAIESGFVPQTDYEGEKFCLKALHATSSFHSKNVLHLSHLKPAYTRSEDLRRFTLKLHSLVAVDYTNEDHLYSFLLGFVMGDLLIVNLTPANSMEGKGYSHALSIGRYILSIQYKNKSLCQRFNKLQELTSTLRDQLFVPMRCQQLNWLNCFIYPSLNGMPAELYDHILKHLNQNQLKILANVNKSLYNLTINSKFRCQNSSHSAVLSRNISSRSSLF